MADPKQDEGFKVVDRRHFTETGDLREGAVEQERREEEAAAKAASAQAGLQGDEFFEPLAGGPVASIDGNVGAIFCAEARRNPWPSRLSASRLLFARHGNHANLQSRLAANKERLRRSVRSVVSSRRR